MGQQYRFAPDVNKAVKVNLLEGAALPNRRVDCISTLRDIGMSPALRNMDRELKQRAASLPNVKQLNKDVNVAFMGLPLHAMNFVDQALPYNFLHCFQIIHDVPASGVYRATDHDLSLEQADLWSAYRRVPSRENNLCAIVIFSVGHQDWHYFVRLQRLHGWM
jgi:hypothetical protein